MLQKAIAGLLTALVLSTCATTAPLAALGCLAHTYIAEQVGPRLQQPNPDLYQIIANNWNEYIVASDYPDTGFMPGATYGEISHWQPFADAYISYLHTAYPDPSSKQSKLIAFLMGVATHMQSDITSHWTYYDLVALHDFNNQPDSGQAWQRAHQDMDPGSDFYVVVNKGIYDHPVRWWVPASDLENVYKIMGKDISAEEIIRSNAIYYLALGLDETLIALPAYLYDRYLEVPWGMANLETPDSPDLRVGAFPGQINDSVNYVNALWAKFQAPNTYFNFSEQQPRKSKSIRPRISAAMRLVAQALDNGWVTFDPIYEPDGSVTFTPECFSKNSTFLREVSKLAR